MIIEDKITSQDGTEITVNQRCGTVKEGCVVVGHSIEGDFPTKIKVTVNQEVGEVSGTVVGVQIKL